jgi:hypothetical protein
MTCWYTVQWLRDIKEPTTWKSAKRSSCFVFDSPQLRLCATPSFVWNSYVIVRKREQYHRMIITKHGNSVNDSEGAAGWWIYLTGRFLLKLQTKNTNGLNYKII